MPKEPYVPRTTEDIEVTPFDSAEEAWFWFIMAQKAREDGARFAKGIGLLNRPCEPIDILKCIDRLYRNRRLQMDHILVLRHYGVRQLAPDPRRVKEARASKLWEEAMERLGDALVAKGIMRGLRTGENHWLFDARIYEGAGGE
jgi:hypothetical protein